MTQKAPVMKIPDWGKWEGVKSAIGQKYPFFKNIQRSSQKIFLKIWRKKRQLLRLQIGADGDVLSEIGNLPPLHPATLIYAW